MPVKNAVPYLYACIDSILEQSYSNWELIAVDDNSSDESLNVLQQYQERNDAIKVYQSTGNGIIDSLKLAYTKSSGEFIHRMDADDIMPIKKLESLLGHWKPKAVVTGKVKYFKDNEKVGSGYVKYQNWINGLVEDKNIWKDPYLECSLPSPAWLMHRDQLDEIGGFNSTLLPEDYDLMFRVYQSRLNIEFVQDVVHLWRDSSLRTSRTNPIYYPIAYYPLKVHYFLEMDRSSSEPLLLWGAGNKGKLIAKLLIEKGTHFIWATNNSNKIGRDIYNIKLNDIKKVDITKFQIILAVSSPNDKLIIQSRLNKMCLIRSIDYFWFC